MAGLVTIAALPTNNFPRVGVPFSLQLSATDSDDPTPAFTWGLVFGTLPPGIDLSASGLLSGTPPLSAAALTYSFIIRAVNTNDGDFAYLVGTLTVDGPAVVAITIPDLSFLFNVAFSKTFTAVDPDDATPAFTWDVLVDGLVPGTTFSPGGLWAGTITPQAGTFVTTIRATNTNNAHFGTATFSVTLTGIGGGGSGDDIPGSLQIITPDVFPREGDFIDLFFGAIDPDDNSPDLEWSIFSGTLPNTTSLAVDGEWSGQISDPAGTAYNFTVQAVNLNSGAFGRRTYSGVIAKIITWWETSGRLPYNYEFIYNGNQYRVTASQVGIGSATSIQQNGLLYIYKSLDGGRTFSFIPPDPARNFLYNNVNNPNPAPYLGQVQPILIGSVLYFLGWRFNSNFPLNLKLWVQRFSLATETWLSDLSFGPTYIKNTFEIDWQFFYGAVLPSGNIAVVYAGPNDGSLWTPYFTILDPLADTWTVGARIFPLLYTTKYMAVTQGTDSIAGLDRGHFIFQASNSPDINQSRQASFELHYAAIKDPGTVVGTGPIAATPGIWPTWDVSFPSVYSKSGTATIAVLYNTRSGFPVTGTKLASSPVADTPTWTIEDGPDTVADTLLPDATEFNLNPRLTLQGDGSILAAIWGASSRQNSDPAWATAMRSATFNGSAWSGITEVARTQGTLIYGPVYPRVGSIVTFYPVEDQTLFFDANGFGTKYFGLLPFSLTPCPPYIPDVPIEATISDTPPNDQ